jgi:PIN domain nuclease of toxin-antitoxin system
MRILIDTNVLIWLLEGSDSLSSRARYAIEDDENSLYLSIVSLWEITIKLSLGKLDLQMPVDKIVKSFVIPGGIEILPIEIIHLSILRDLPLHHRDPFDRLLIAQAKAEQMNLLSVDGVFDLYGVELLW